MYTHDLFYLQQEWEAWLAPVYKQIQTTKSQLTQCTKYNCNGAEWSKDKTQAAESIQWRPQQAYGSNQVLLSQPQTIFSTPKILTLTHR